MSLIVEDGSMVPGAESYISVADAITYFNNRNQPTFAALDTPTQEALLRLATDFMTQMYHTKWGGFRYNVNQSLDWPRVWVPIIDVASSYGPAPNYIVPTIVPQLVQYACAELAIRSNTYGSLVQDVERIESMVKVGSIQIEYDATAPAFTVYRQIDLMLKQFFKFGGGSSIPIYRS